MSEQTTKKLDKLVEGHHAVIAMIDTVGSPLRPLNFEALKDLLKSFALRMYMLERAVYQDENEEVLK